MKDFSKATPRPWKLIPDEKQCMISINTVDAESALDSSIAGLWGWRNREGEPQMSDAELIVTAVNNFDKMKEFISELSYFIDEVYSEGYTQVSSSDTRYFKKKAEQLLESLK